MAAREQGNQKVVDDLVLSDDALADLGTQDAAGVAQLAGCGDVALDDLRRWPRGSFTSTRRENRRFL
jgi:hypothetical protein